MSTRLVLASNNAKKAAEMQALLAPLGIEVIPQAVFGVGEAEEPHPSFVENALAKARNCARHTGHAALAEVLARQAQLQWRVERDRHHGAAARMWVAGSGPAAVFRHCVRYG